MRIRTILAAAAAPAALAAVLLGTAGQASAATAPAPAVLAASVQHAPHAVTAVTYRNGVEDTASLAAPQNGVTWQQQYPAVVMDPTYGPVWAHDYLAFHVTAAPVAGQSDAWNVTIHENGVYVATANPVTGAAWNHTGVFAGTLTYQVTTAGTPAARNLPTVEPGTAHTSDILSQLFGGAGLTYGASTYSFTYYGIPGFPGGWTQNG